MRTTNIRFTGLASGLDTESMVQAMIMPYKNNVDSAIQQQKLLELKKDAWKEMNNKIHSFYKDVLSELRMEGSFNQKEVTVSKPGIVEIGTSGSFPDGTHTIEDVTLATGATVTTTQIGKDGSTKLSDIGITADTSIKVTVNGGQEVTIDLKPDMTLDQVAKELEKTGMSANYDSTAGAFFISSKETGEKQTIKFDGDTVALGNLGIAVGEAKGGNASVTYNGIKVESETNTVTVNGMSIKLLSESTGEKINIVSKADTTKTKEMIVNFVDKYNALIEDINKKVNAAYNKDYLPLTDEQKKEMSEEDIKLWNAKVESSILRKDPVLQSIASSMRSIITDTALDTDQDGKADMTLASFGITTTMNYKDGGKLVIDEEKLDTMLAKNPEAFKELFTKRVDAKDLAKKDWEAAGKNGTFEDFWKSSDQKKYQSNAMSQSGIGVRLYNDISERLRGSTLNSSNFLFNDKEIDDKIKKQKEEVFKLEDRMNRMETLYYSKFTAMEKMLSNMNNQSSWLAGQLGGM